MKSNLKKLNIKAKKSGFTLVEMLLATVMATVIAVATYGMLSNGIKVWQTVNQKISRIDIGLFFEKIELDLKNCLVHKNIYFSGSQNTVYFPVVAQGTAVDGSLYKSLGQVMYFYDPVQKTINRNYKNYQQLFSGKKGQSRPLVTGVESLIFEYYFYDAEKKDFFWSINWPVSEQKSVFPLALRLTMMLDIDGRLAKSKKTIFIPQGGLLF